MSEIIWLFIIMLIVASLSFAPLAYFVYMYTMKEGEPFGDIEPHGDSASPLLKTIETIVDKVKQIVSSQK